MTTTTGTPADKIPAEEPARYFMLNPDDSVEIRCPDCGECIWSQYLPRTDDLGIGLNFGALTLGDLWDAANAHVCADEED